MSGFWSIFSSAPTAPTNQTDYVQIVDTSAENNVTSNVPNTPSNEGIVENTKSVTADVKPIVEPSIEGLIVNTEPITSSSSNEGIIVKTESDTSTSSSNEGIVSTGLHTPKSTKLKASDNDHLLADNQVIAIKKKLLSEYALNSDNITNIVINDDNLSGIKKYYHTGKLLKGDIFKKSPIKFHNGEFYDGIISESKLDDTPKASYSEVAQKLFGPILKNPDFVDIETTLLSFLTEDKIYKYCNKLNSDPMLVYIFDIRRALPDVARYSTTELISYVWDVSLKIQDVIKCWEIKGVRISNTFHKDSKITSAIGIMVAPIVYFK